MATMNASEVGVGAAAVTGAIFVAPQNTSLPSDATTALGGTWTLLGFTSDAGVTISESRSTDEIRAWEGRTVVYNTVTEYTESVSFTPIQVNGDVAKLTWGAGNVTVSSSTLYAKHSAANLDPVCIVIETTPRPGIVKRYCGTFQLVERGDATLDGTQVDGRQLTFNAIADSNGVTLHEYTAFTAGATS